MQCLAAGSSIMNREVESASMRPLAKALTRHLDFLRSILRDQCLKNLNFYTDTIREAIMVFDKLFSEFELRLVVFARFQNILSRAFYCKVLPLKEQVQCCLLRQFQQL